MSTNSTMINDRCCWNCGLSSHGCVKDELIGYCIDWMPTEIDFDDIDFFKSDPDV